MKLRKYQKILLGLVILGIVVAGGGYVSYKGYRSWRQKRLVAQAREFLQQGEERKGLLALRRALSINSRDIEACRMMAAVAERRSTPEALIWRQRIAELNPGSMEDQLALAQTAVMFRDFGVATNALEKVDDAARGTAAYQNVAGGVASTLGRWEQAERHFQEAARLEPANPFIQLNLAVIRLQGSNAPAVLEAKTSLQELSVNPTNSALRCRALRELIGHSLRTGETNTAVNLADKLVQEPEMRFSDRLLRLDVLGLTRNPEFPAALQVAQVEATNSPASMYEMGKWQMLKIPPSKSLEWMGTLPADAQTNSALAIMASDLRVAVRDWAGLQASLEGQNWGGLEFMRLAFRTIALRGQGLTAAADADWAQVMKLTGGDKTALTMLLRVVAQWRWPNEMREILSAIVSRYPGEKWASGLLTQNLLSEGQTRSLLTLFRQQLAATPTDMSVKNNLAMTALLLEASELRPHDMAKEVYDSAPTNPAFVSTYAFSLYVQEKASEAKQVIEQLPAAQLEDPAIAGYYGLILIANGEAEKAKKYMDLGATAKLLPEEKTLFERAQRGG